MAALIVWTRIDQNMIRKNEVILIHSHRKINETRSKVQKNINAS